MGYGWNALVMAAHLGFCTSAALLLWRLIPRLGSASVHAVSARSRGFAAAYFVASLLGERVYYLLARTLRPLGYDLWQAHPAPGVVATLVFAGSLVFLAAFTLAFHEDPRRIRIEVTVFGVFWFIAVGVLW